MPIVNHIRMSLLASWLAVAIYFSAVVAPSAFAVMRSFGLANSSEVAGSVVTHTLYVVNLSGLLLSLALLASSFAVKKYYIRAAFILHNVLLIAVALMTAIGEWVIASRMRDLRAAMHGQIDQVAVNDPNRMAFATLHGYSVTALSVAMVAALIAVFIMIYSREKADSPSFD